jgi:hypothetical protein
MREVKNSAYTEYSPSPSLSFLPSFLPSPFASTLSTLQKQKSGSVLAYYDFDVSAALIHLFPDIGFDKDRFISTVFDDPLL